MDIEHLILDLYGQLHEHSYIYMKRHMYIHINNLHIDSYEHYYKYSYEYLYED